METLAEWLKTADGQREAFAKIAEHYRLSGLWGTRGLCAKVAFQTGFTPAYVGQVFNRKKPITVAFYIKALVVRVVEPFHSVADAVQAILMNKVPATVSRNEFCRASGVNRNSFDRYIAGISEPSQESLERIAAYFGITFSIRVSPAGTLVTVVAHHE